MAWTRIGGVPFDVTEKSGRFVFGRDGEEVCVARTRAEAYDAVATFYDEPDPVVDPVVARAKLEILDDVRAGVVPADVGGFSDLHDHVDANCYGGLCDGDWTFSENFAVENGIQDALDAWIRHGGIAP